MRVGDLVFRAGNVLKFAYLERAELTRRTLGQAGENAIRVEIDLNKSLEGNGEHNLFLQDFDHLMVRQVPDIELQRDIELTDESRLQAGRQGEQEQLRLREGGLVDRSPPSRAPGDSGQLRLRDADPLNKARPLCEFIPSWKVMSRLPRHYDGLEDLSNMWWRSAVRFASLDSTLCSRASALAQRCGAPGGSRRMPTCVGPP
jgi:hypothetical protein